MHKPHLGARACFPEEQQCPPRGGGPGLLFGFLPLHRQGQRQHFKDILKNYNYSYSPAILAHLRLSWLLGAGSDTKQIPNDFL